MRDVKGFNFALLAPAFSIDGEEAVTDFARWCNHFVEEMVVDDLIPEDVPTTDDDDMDAEEGSEVESEGGEDASEGDVEDTKALEKSNVPSRYLAAVAGKDLEAFCLGMGVHPPVLGDHAPDRDRALELEQLMLNQTVAHVRKTFTDYYGYANMYFVWLYSTEGMAEKWDDGEDLLVTHTDLLRFLVDYSSSRVRATGSQPWIADVLRGEAAQDFTLVPKDPKRVSASTLKKISSSVSRFEALQHAVLGKPIFNPVAKHVSIRSFLKRAKVAGPDDSRKHLLDRQRRVNLPGFQLNKKIKESNVYLSRGWATDIRDRAAMACATFSISRHSEAMTWELPDLFMYTYPMETIKELQQTMEIVYVLQGRSKTRCDEDTEDWNCLTRNRFVEQCPLGSLALWFFWRFHLLKEPFPDIAGEKASWYSVKVFSHSRDPTTTAKPESNRQRKKSALEKTGTKGRAVLHDDRHFGSWWARLHEVPSSELDLLGFWRMDTRTQVYTKMHIPTTIIKVSGFSSISEFFLPRAVLSPYDCEDEDIEAFADAVFAQLNDPEFIAGVEQKCQGTATESDYASRRASEVLKLFRKILLQDLYYYKENWPELDFWSADIFVEHSIGAEKWLNIQAEVVAELEGLVDRFGGPPRLMTAASRRPGSIVSAHGPTPDGFVKKPLEGSTHLALLFKATAIDESAAAPDTTARGQLHDVTMAEDVASTRNSLRGVWGVLEHHTAQMGLLRNEVRENTRIVKETKEACAVIPTAPVVQTSAQLEQSLFGEAAVHVEPATGLEFEHRPLDTQTLPTKERDYLVEKLPSLSNYTLETLMHEWLVEFDIAGVEEKLPMGRLERLRSEADANATPWRSPKLRNAVFKRKSICEHVQRIAASKFGGHEPQQIQQAIEDVRTAAREKLGAKWTLRGLYNDINGYKDKKSAKHDSGGADE